MELNGDSNSSENDRKMMSSFERFDDKEDSKEKKKKSKDKTSVRIFEAPSEEKKPEKRGNIFDSLDRKPEKNQTQNSKDLEKLSEEESRVVAQELVNARAEDLKEELEQTPPDSLREAQVLADAAFIEALSDRLTDQQPVDDEILDETLDQTLNDLEIEEPPEEAPAETEPDLLPVVDEEVEKTEQTPVVTPAPTTGPSSPPYRPPTLPPSSPPPGGGSTGSGGAAGIPPPGFTGSTGGNTMPPSPNVNTVDQNQEALYYSTRRRAGDILMGGIIGYLIGRRRGRIKTEKRLIPIQEKLEEQVEDLQAKIEIREQKIRKLVANQVGRQPEAARPPAIEKLTERIEQRIASRPEDIEENSQSEETEVPTASLGESQPEIITFSGAERLARVIVPKPEAVESIQATVSASTQERQRDISSLTTPELLEIAANIKVEGASVKTMYEKGTLDAVGLRRVVGEYLHGENYERTFFYNLQAAVSPERMNASAQQSADNSNSSGGGANPYAPPLGKNEFISPRESSFPVSTPEIEQTVIPKSRKTSRKLASTGIAIGILLALGFVLFLLFR